MSKDKTRPFWQSTPCPPWCGIIHRKADHPADRYHHSEWAGLIKLSLEEPDQHGERGSYTYSVPLRWVYVRQDHREIEPRIVVEGGPPGSGKNVQLTVGEALELSRALVTACDVAEGHANPAAPPVPRWAS